MKTNHCLMKMDPFWKLAQVDTANTQCQLSKHHEGSTSKHLHLEPSSGILPQGCMQHTRAVVLQKTTKRERTAKGRGDSHLGEGHVRSQEVLVEQKVEGHCWASLQQAKYQISFQRMMAPLATRQTGQGRLDGNRLKTERVQRRVRIKAQQRKTKETSSHSSCKGRSSRTQRTEP